MASVEKNSSYPEVDRYWNLVKETLEHVFQKSAGVADVLRKEIDKRPAEEQLLFYHAEPLDVAADLARKHPNTSEVQAYLSLASKAGWK